MIGKVIRMNRHQHRALKSRLRRLQGSIVALTRYVVDADPHGLIELAAGEILSITDYALAVRQAGIEPGEKVEAFGTRNLLGVNLGAWQAEMLAVAARAPRVANPVVHIVLSLHAGETWSEAEREEAITVILETLGLERCQTIWAEHSNTANPHLHLSIIRVDPVTGQAAGTDWLIDDLHQAIALVEERQDRVREPQAIYIAHDGAVFDSETKAMVRDVHGVYLADWYKSVGKKRTWLPSNIRAIRAGLVQAAGEAGSWEDMHQAFRELGADYDKAGSGARIRSGASSVKASEVHGSLSRPELEKRFGPFEADRERTDLDYEAFRLAFEQQLSWLREKRNAQCDLLDVWAMSRIAALPTGASKHLSPFVREEAEQAKAALRQAFANAIRRCTHQRMTKEKWVSAGSPSAPQQVSAPAVIFPALPGAPEMDARHSTRYDKKDDRWATAYHDESGKTLFVDFRTIIIVQSVEDVRVIDEVLGLASARWGIVSLSGPPAFMRLATERAHALRIEAVDSSGAVLSPKGIAISESAGNGVEQRADPRDAQTVIRHPTIFVNDALSYLRRYPSIPVRRRMMASDTEQSGWSGPFEIVLAWRGREIEEHAMCDQDVRVQEFLQERHRQRVDECQAELLARCPGPLPKSKATILHQLSSEKNLHLFAQGAFEDLEFINMLNNVRSRLKERKRPVELAETVNMAPKQVPELLRNGRDEFQEAVDLQDQWKQRQARQID